VLRRLEATLSTDERARANRFLFQPDRNHSIATRGILRELLGRYLNRAPEHLEFDHAPQGKPTLHTELPHASVRFNVSHSHGMALLAFTVGRQVGVDLELVRKFGGQEIAERFFSPREVMESVFNNYNMQMSKATEMLQAARKRAMAGRPKVGGFPYLAETLRRAGVTLNLWHLPSCQSLYLTKEGPVVSQGAPLVSGTTDVPVFDRDALIRALRIDQAGKSTFPEFLAASWHAGVIRYDVDFNARTVAYYGCNGEEYIESYPHVEVD
jgi:uncharacterized protein YbcV (DUF1398 family)